MISFRNHLLSLVAVFAALAVGIVLGGGPLGDAGSEDAAPSAAEAAEPGDGYGDDFAAAVAPTLYANRLADMPVLVWTMPGADPGQVEQLQEQVAAAGGTVAAVQELGEALVSPGEKALVDTLGSQLVEQLPKDAVADDATTYERIGELLGRATTTDAPEGADRDAASTTVLEGMKGAGLLAEVPALERRVPLVLVVLGDPVDGDEGGDDIVGGLVRGLSRASLGTVVADESAEAGSQLTRLREAGALGEAVSVDGIDTVPGRAAAVLGLARSLGTPGGSFGATGGDGAVPLG